MSKTFEDDPAEDINAHPDDSFQAMPAPSMGAPVAANTFGAQPAAGGFGPAPMAAVPSMGGFAGAAAPRVAAPAQQVDTSAFHGATMDPELAKEPWMKSYWRPAMGWLYLAVCAFDFIVGPILWAIIQFWEKEAANDAFRQWEPLTLQGAGMFHIAMGAILGISAWGRTKEKEAGKN